MKKIVLSLASVLAATAFAPEAAAIPSFARQTGMACNACHFQHFPVLNSFGMAFKSAGYTMMGSQGKVEGEHLSLPDTLNLSMLMKLRYQKDSQKNGVPEVNGQSRATGQWQLPDELSLFMGGRVAENVGVFTELSLNGAAGGPASNTVAAMKVPFMFDAGGAKVGVIPYFTSGAGAAFAYELSSDAVVRAIRWTEQPDASAADYIGFGGTAASGIAFVAKNDMGYINFSRWSPTYMGSAGPAGATTELKNNWLRIAATPTYADWNMHIGLGFASGTSNTGGTVALPVRTETRATLLNFQGQTQLGGKDFSLYASYARAPISSATAANLYNAATTGSARTAWGIGADYSVIPHVLHIAGGYRRGDTGAAVNNKSNDWVIQGIYDLTQNVALHLVHSSYGGSARTPVPATATVQTSRTTAMLEMAW